MTIQLTQPRIINGSAVAAGSQHTLDEATEAYFVHHGLATYVSLAGTGHVVASNMINNVFTA